MGTSLAGDSQTFEYDSLDRLVKATGTSPAYYQDYTYDAVGNLMCSKIGTSLATATSTAYGYGAPVMREMRVDKEWNGVRN